MLLTCHFGSSLFYKASTIKAHYNLYCFALLHEPKRARIRRFVNDAVS